MIKPKLIAVVGPTASGKTEYAIQLAGRLNGAVVSADSRQIYAGMNIGTATPVELSATLEPHHYLQPDVIQGVEHYLLNITPPDKPITLAQWQDYAWRAIEHILAAGSTPLLVGGTMLYVDSIINEYQIPSVQPDAALRRQLERQDTKLLYEKLLAKDPKAQQFVEAHHKRRIIRALEVIEATGQPFSEQRVQREPRYQVQTIGLFPKVEDRPQGWDTLQERLVKRAQQMFADDLLNETKLLQSRYGSDLSLLRTPNYRQAVAVLAGTMSQAEAVADMVRSDMRYAHRQLSWWRRRPEISWQS